MTRPYNATALGEMSSACYTVAIPHLLTPSNCRYHTHLFLLKNTCSHLINDPLDRRRCLLEAEAVILPGTLTIPDEVTARGVKSQSRLSFDSAHIAVVPPVQLSRASFFSFQLLLLTLVDAKLFPDRPGKASQSSLVTWFSLGV